MESIDYIKLLSRWAHILPSIILVGGAIFMNTVLIPALRDNSEATQLQGKIKRLSLIHI